jgi:N-acetylmuramoyl-L-alanine amidase
MRKINKIILHCSATVEGRDFDKYDIDKWHRAKGWRGIGYHYVIKLDGTIERGRALDRTGAHTRGFNKGSIGICYIGGLGEDRKAKDTRTPEQVIAIRELVGELLTKFNEATVRGHYEFSSKSCPCFNVRTEL